MHKNAFAFAFMDLLTTNITNPCFSSVHFVYFCSELLSLAKPQIIVNGVAWILPLLSQLIQVLIPTNRIEISHMIRSLASFTRRLIKHGIYFKEAQQCVTLLLLTLCTPNLQSQRKVNILYACSDLADQENVLTSFSVNQRQFENILCNAAESDDTLHATWKFIRRIIIGQQNYLTDFLNSGNVHPILVELLSAPDAELDVFINLSKILISLPKKGSIPNGIKCFFDIVRESGYNYFNVMKHQITTVNKFFAFKIAQELEKRPNFWNIQNMIEM